MEKVFSSAISRAGARRRFTSIKRVMLIPCGIRSQQPALGASLLPMADSWRFSVKNSMGISGRWRTFDNEPRCGLPRVRSRLLDDGLNHTSRLTGVAPALPVFPHRLGHRLRVGFQLASG